MYWVMIEVVQVPIALVRSCFGTEVTFGEEVWKVSCEHVVF